MDGLTLWDDIRANTVSVFERWLDDSRKGKGKDKGGNKKTLGGRIEMIPKKRESVRITVFNEEIDVRENLGGDLLHFRPQ
ncbi:predicted protein [Sclerotinia sclerotiorum 1980 UF-70]|uniref:Uncharacterized protein n=1 Tax=Sclerotinia sclerotiorum (strain ATCC 18683 / 1980 / Ss-1) TaxID=665079 RepID=A7EJG9_SCLS1|nr:predicted protein [Sclerotinia sclerotiorum 1980 UF-70]EDO02985.1 predicted protein [Sclerotinia sclerotiorum 1980 UF-70]